MNSLKILLCVCCLVCVAQAAPFHGDAIQWLRNGNEKKLLLSFDNYRVETVEVDGQRWGTLRAPGASYSNDQGLAQLPYFYTALQLPPDQKLAFDVESETHEDMDLVLPLLPAKGTVYRHQHPNTVPYTLDREAYQLGFLPASTVDLGTPYIYRDIKGQNLYFNPVQYDAVNHRLRITHSMTLILRWVPDDQPNALLHRNCHPVGEMDDIYQSLFINYEPLRSRWPHELPDKGDILVVTTARHQAVIEPYVAWKKQKGFGVTVVEVPTGAHAKQAVADAYKANNKLLYVQLIGDWYDIRSERGTSHFGAMDPALGCVEGNDDYPELIVGRFSGSSPEQITAQVNKTIAYEQKKETGPWIETSIHIASREGSGFGDDGESDQQHNDKIIEGRLKPKGWKNSFKAYDPFLGSFSNKSLMEAWNAGASVLFYSGHADVYKWASGRFDSGDADKLKNGSKLPIVCCAACTCGDVIGDCLAEHLMRNPNGGMIAGMFASANQVWVEPMRAQDYFADLLTGGYAYQGKEKGIDNAVAKTTYGAIATNACILMLTEGKEDKRSRESFLTWLNFGDVSLEVTKPTPAPAPEPTPAPAPTPTPGQ